MATGEFSQRSRGSALVSVVSAARAFAALAALLVLFSAPAAMAQEAPASPSAAAPAAEPSAAGADVSKPAAAKAEAAPNHVVIPIVLARELREEPLPLSLLDLPPKDLGIAGAKLAITDNNTTGRFMNQEFKLDPIENSDPAKLIEEVVQKVDAGAHFIIVDASPETLLKMADAVKGKEALLINYSAADDSLREENCRPHVLHTAPTRSMLTDALAQYLVWKKWPHWLLVLGPHREGQALRRVAASRREALRRQDRRGAHIQLRLAAAGAPMAASSRCSSKSRRFTQNAPDYEVLVVADEGNCSATTCRIAPGYRARLPAPPASSLQSWHPAIELWGGTQFQNRFKRLS